MALEAHVTWWCTEIGNTTLTHVKNNRTQILRPKKKHRRKKKLMNRKRMPQHFIEAGLHWIKTLLIRGSVSLLANSVCLWFSSYNSFLDDSVESSGTKKEDLDDKEKKDETPAPVYRAKSILDSWVWSKQPGMFMERKAPKDQKHPPAGPALGPGHPAGAGCAERHVEDIEAKKEAQKKKEIDEQEVNASTFHRSRTPLDKDLINMGICESSGKQCLPLVQLIQQLLSQC
nr:uncharacterized protein LOC103889753 isoform X2 [Pongo abelii]